MDAGCTKPAWQTLAQQWLRRCRVPPLPPLLQVAIRGSAEFRKDALGISKVSTNSGVLPAVKAAAEKVPAAAAAILLQLGEPGGGPGCPLWQQPRSTLQAGSCFLQDAVLLCLWTANA